MPQTGKNKGNINASLKPGQRGRIGWSQCLCDEELMLVLTHLGIQDLNDNEARKRLREQSEKLFEDWLTSLG